MASIVAKYLFDEGSGTTLIDHSGNGLNGTLGGGGFTAPTWVAGGGLTFNGVNDAVVVPSPATPLRLPTAHSIEAIFKWTSGNGGIYDKTGVGDATNKSYQLFVEANRLVYRCEKGVNVDATDGVLTGGNLYHAIATYDNASMNVYLNGVNTAFTGLVGPIDNPASGDVLIGHLGSGVYPFNGTIYYLVIYDYALTPEAVAGLQELRASGLRTTEEYTAADVMASGLRTATEYTDNTVRVSGLRTITDFTAATSIISGLRTIWEYDVGTPVTPPGDTGLPPPPPVEPCPDTNLGQGPPVPRGCEVQIGGIPTTGTPLTYGVAFRLYRKDCEIRMKNWGAVDSYHIEKPFGGESFERGALI